MKKPKVLFIVPYPSQGASNRLRVEQYLPYLDKEGIPYLVRPFVCKNFYKILYMRGRWIAKTFYFIFALLNRFFDVFRAFRYDIIFIHREALPIGSVLIETLISKIPKKIIFDYDDAIFLPNTSKTNNYIERFKNPAKVSRIIALSDCVIAGNSYLEEYAKKFNDKVIIIPTPIDAVKYTAKADKGPSSEITIGWIGSFTTRIYLEHVRHVLESLKLKYPNLRLKFIGNWSEFDNPIDGAVYKEWSLEDELSDIGSFDIGIMPMPDDMWTKGKCAFKIILYMACGIPVVSAPVGMNRAIIKEGENGFFASSEEEWLGKISRLIVDAKLRRDIGMAGRRTIEEKYSVAATAPHFINILKECAA